MKHERISFLEAIGDPLLFKTQFNALSVPQQVILKSFYGLPLNQEERLVWSLLQGSAEFDELGYPIKIKEIPYEPQEYDSLVMVLGRRSGKTSGPMAFVFAYEATCGGHLEYVARRQELALFFTAQTAQYASDHILQFVLPLLEDSKLISKRIEKFNSDGITLSSGFANVSKKSTIRPAPPSIKAFRGPAIPVIGMDEAAFWYKDAESANPDYEVERAVDKAQGQFPFRKKVVGSTPWTKEGILFDAHNAGTRGSKSNKKEIKDKFSRTVVVGAPTPAMENPLLSKLWFEQERARDPEAYKREILAQFVDAVNGIFTESLLRAAIEGQPSTSGGVEHADRPFKPGRYYIAAMDPAFKKDAFAFTIGHWEPELCNGRPLGIVQDLIRRWKATSKKDPLKPAEILDEIKPLLDRYQIVNVLSDQYQLESLQQLALDRGFSIEGVTFTAQQKVKIYGTALMAARTRQLHLIDDDELFQELLQVQKTLLPQGGLHIGAPSNKHDDLATVTVLMAWRALQMKPFEVPKSKEEPEERETHLDRGFRHLQRKEQALQDEDDW